MTRTALIQRSLCAASLAVAALSLAAEPEAVPAVTLEQALAMARVQSPRVHVSNAGVEVAAANASMARSQWLPRVGALAELIQGTTNNSTTQTLSSSYVPLPRIGGTPQVAGFGSASWTPHASTLVGLGLSQEVFDFGRVAAQIAAADTEQQSAEARRDLVERDVVRDVREAYAAVRAAHSVLSLARAAVQRISTHRDMVKAAVEAKLRARFDLERSEADLARAQSSVVRAQAGLKTAQTLLAAVVGAEQSALDAQQDPPLPSPLQSLEELAKKAASEDPVVRSARAALASAARQTHAAGTATRPDLSLSGLFSTRAGGALATADSSAVPQGNGYLPVIPNWSVALVLSVPVFDPVLNARAAVARAQEKGAHAVLEEAVRNQKALLAQAYQNAEALSAEIPSLEKAAVWARLNQEQAAERFRTGLGTALEIADAERLRVESEMQLLLSRFQEARARAQLDRLTGS